MVDDVDCGPSGRRRRRNTIISILSDYSVTIGLVLRLFLAWLLPYLLDNERFIPGVAYTDIDFHVFSDAASYVQQGESPYQRTTYRYTPFLATLLASLPSREAGRYLFCIADAICGWIILLYRRQNRAPTTERFIDEPNAIGEKRSEEMESQSRLLDAIWWLYNPLAINICTRGSAESLVVLLPVLCTLGIASSISNQSNHRIVCGAAVASGLCHGVAIHAKLYPVIYTLSFMTSFVERRSVDDGASVVGKSSRRHRALHEILTLWIRRLLSPAPILFGLTSVATFVGLTYLAVLLYGDVALQEGLLYHFSRVDHRHNYSMHWYWIYLARDRVALHSMSMAWIGRILLIPQLILLAYTSLGIAPRNLALALFVQTFLFVAHNKVITAQYFTWYLCLLPLCSNQMTLTPRVGTAVALLVGSILTWLGTAYCLEMQGMAMHSTVWVASLLFFAANVNLLGALLASTQGATPTSNESSSVKKSN